MKKGIKREEREEHKGRETNEWDIEGKRVDKD